LFNSRIKQRERQKLHKVARKSQYWETLWFLDSKILKEWDQALYFCKLCINISNSNDPSDILFMWSTRQAIIILSGHLKNDSKWDRQCVVEARKTWISTFTRMELLSCGSQCFKQCRVSNPEPTLIKMADIPPTFLSRMRDGKD
jgi:hypothetical protein